MSQTDTFHMLCHWKSYKYSQHNRIWFQFFIFLLTEHFLFFLDVSAARVFLSEEQANQLLNTELRNGKLAGPTCECCMHRCTSNEFEQYCSPMSTPRRRRQTRRTRRTRRSAIKEKHFTESAISDMYEAINRDLVQEISEPDSELLSLHQVEQLTVLNGWKIKNTINSEIRELFQLRRSVPIPAEQSHLSPPDSEPMNSNREWLDKTDTNAQNAEHPTKPKLLARNALMRENQHTRSSTGHRRHRHGHHQPPKHQQPPESDIP